MKRKIVIIGAVMFPRNSPRAHRTTELAIELAKQGNEVILYASLGEFDYSEFERTFKVTVKNIGEIKFIPLNSDGEIKRNINGTLLRFLNKLLDFPMIEYVFKIPRLLKGEKNVDLLITVAIPYTIHWGAALAKTLGRAEFPKVWVADCGDPYMGNKFHKKLFYFKYVEKWFCRSVDYLSVPLPEARNGYYKEFHDKIKIIPQGFNFDKVNVEKVEIRNPVPTFIYAGGFYENIRDPRPLLNYLITSETDFLFIIFTNNKILVEPYLANLAGKLIVNDYIPRDELLVKMSQADFLLNFENKTNVQSPSKLIDYSLSKRPILSIDSFDFDRQIVEDFLSGDYSNQLIIRDIEQYNIVNVAKKFLDLAN